MYKITNETFGEITVNGKPMGYKGVMIIKELDAKITELAENRIIKIKPMQDKKDFSKTIDDKSKKKISGGK